MNFETPYVEYVIVGTHTSIWLLFVIMAVFGIPLDALSNINLGIVVLLIPMVYLLGALFSTLTSHLIDGYRTNIRNTIFSSDQYKDEIIAYLSPDLFAVYSVQMHRVRLMGPSIFNWLFLGIALLIYTGFSKPSVYIPAVTIPILLSILSATAWRFLVIRALKYRKNAIDVIREESKRAIPPKRHKKNS